MASLAQLWVEFRASTDKMQADLKAAQKEAKEFEKALKPAKDMALDFGKALTAVGGLVVGSMLAMTKSAADFGESLKNLHEKTGIAVESASKLGFAAEQNESSFEGLSTGVKFLAKNMEAAIQKSGEQRDAFQDLGISAQQLQKMGGDLNKVFLTVADRFKAMPDGAEKSALAMKIFGKAGTELIPTLNLGSAGLEEFGKQAEKLGIVMDGTAAAAGDEFGDTLKQLETATKGLSISVANALMPALTDLAGFLRDTIADVARFAKEHENLTKAVFGLAAVLTGAGGLLLAFVAVSVIVPKVSAAMIFFTGAETAAAAATSLMASALAAIPWVAAIAGAVALVKVLYDVYATMQNNAEAARQVESAQAQSNANIQKSIKFLEDHGKHIDQTGKSWSQLAEETRIATQEYFKAHPAIQAVTAAHKLSSAELKANAEAADKAAKAHNALNKEIFAAGEFWRKEEKEASAAMERNMDLTLSLGELRMKREALSVAMERNNKINELSVQSTDLLVDSLKNVDAALAPMLRDLEAERGVNIAVQRTVEEVNKEMGISVDLIAEVTGARREDIIAIRDRAKEEAKGTSAAQKAAESYQRMWEQATSQVTANFVKGLSDVIFHAKNFMSAMKDIAMQTAEAMFQAFATGLLSPLTGALSGLGKTLSGVLMGGVGGGGGAAGSAAGAAGAIGGGGSGAMAAIGAFATNPITLAVAGAIAAGFAIHHFVGQGRRSADEFVQSVENPFGKNLSALVDSFDSMKNAGTLTEDAAKSARDAVSKLWEDFLKANSDFAKQGGTEAKVAGQSLAHFAEIFGPNLQKVLGNMDDTIATLQHGGVAGVAATAAGASNAPITVNNDYNPSFTFYGVPESLEREIRDTIEPALMSDFANNTRGLTAQLVTILENARNGVTNQIPATV